MLELALIVARKDLRIIFGGAAKFCQAILLGLILIFVFALARGTGELFTPQEAAAIFWLSSVFCQTLVFGQIYGIEEDNDNRQALLLSSLPVQGIWLGKALAGFALILLAQIIFLPAIVVFLNQSFRGPLLPGVTAIFLVDMGLAILGSLLGALASGRMGRDAVLSILLFPLLVPQLLAGISLGAHSFGSLTQISVNSWLGLAISFDALFAGVALLLFGFLYRSA